MNILLDEILSNETIRLNEALEMLHLEIEEMDYFSQQEMKEDLLHAFSA